MEGPIFFSIIAKATVACLQACLLGGVPLRGAGGGGGRGASSRGAPAPPGGLATATPTSKLKQSYIELFS